MNIPKVSICITTYNVATYISQTLDSVLSQQVNFQYEICISDDCSTDNTREILSIYVRKYPDIIRLNLPHFHRDVNKNDYDLILMAKGEYIAWCDGDDYWISKDKLQKQIDILDTCLQYSCAITYWRDYIEKEGKYEDHIFEWENRESFFSGKESVQQLIMGQFIGIRFSSLVCRTGILRNHITSDPDLFLNKNHTTGNDVAIFCILANKGLIYLLKEITVVYRIRQESLSLSSDDIKLTYNAFYYYMIGLHIISIFNLPNSISQKYCRRILNGILRATFYYHLNKLSEEAIKQTHSYGYSLSISQKLLYVGSKYKWMFFLLKPIFNVYNKIRN